MSKSPLSSVFLLLIMLASPASCAPSGAVQPPPPGSALQDVLVGVQTGLQSAQSNLAMANLPTLDSVQLTLHTQVDKDATGKVKIFVISFGGGTAASNAQEIVLNLVPPDPATRAPIPVNTLADQLAALIQQAAVSVNAAKSGPVPLSAESVSVEIDLVLTNSGSGGVSLQLAPVSIDLGGDLKRQLVQKVKVTFKRKTK